MLIANEIVLVRSPSDAADVAETPAPAEEAATPAAEPVEPTPKRRRAKPAV